MELLKVAELQKDMAKKREINMESCRMALAGKKPEPVRAAHRVTKTEEFHFETDSRIKDHSAASGSGQEVDFVSLLRKNDAPTVSFAQLNIIVI